MNPTCDPGLEYAELRPAGPLGVRVRCIWALRAPADPHAGFEPVFPDGCMELVFNLADQFERFRGNTIERQARSLLVGQMLGPVRIRPTGITDIVGIRFQPWGLCRAGVIDPNELVDRTVISEEVAPGLTGSIAALSEIPSLERRCGFLARALASDLFPPFRTEPPAALVALANGRVQSVSAAAEAAGITPRQLERLSRQWIGYPRMSWSDWLASSVCCTACGTNRPYHWLGSRWRAASPTRRTSPGTSADSPVSPLPPSAPRSAT
jgi:hypothetical protein